MHDLRGENGTLETHRTADQRTHQQRPVDRPVLKSQPTLFSDIKIIINYQKHTSYLQNSWKKISLVNKWAETYRSELTQGRMENVVENH